MNYDKIYNNEVNRLSRTLIINCAREDEEKPMGWILTYLKDMYNIPKPDGWPLAERILDFFHIDY